MLIRFLVWCVLYCKASIEVISKPYQKSFSGIDIDFVKTIELKRGDNIITLNEVI